MTDLQVVAYLRATKKEEPVWSEDCVCQDPVYPSDPDGSDEDCISMPLVRLSDANARIAALEESELAAHNLAARMQIELDAAKADRDSWYQQHSDRVDDVLKVAAEVEALRLPASYGGSTVDAWGDEGCTVRIHCGIKADGLRWAERLLSGQKGKA